MTEWNDDMSAAPQDESVLIFCPPSRVLEAFVEEIYGVRRFVDPVEHYESYSPTHWMPLPPPPTAIAEDA